MKSQFRFHAFTETCRQFLKHGIWRQPPQNASGFRRGLHHTAHIGRLVVSGFRRNQCSLHAASLTFFSMMALIPILAMTLAMARAFGGAGIAKAQFNKQLDQWMVQMEQAVEAKAKVETENQAAVQTQAEVTKAFSSQVRDIADKLFRQLDELKFGRLGGIGAVMLIWTVIGMLGKVEASFNQIWEVDKSRALVRKCSDYLFVCMILPFLITAASTVPVAAMVTEIMDKTVGAPATHALRTLIGSGLFKMSVTLGVGTLTFAFLLGFMPNTRVKTGPALIGGLVTMALFVGWLKLCAMAQIGIGKYSMLYGGFAVMPILLMWMYTSWQIILLGALIAFAVQNHKTFGQRSAATASPRARLLMAVTLCSEMTRQAREKTGGPFSAETFIRERNVPERFVNDILGLLVCRGIAAEIAGHPGCYLLCRCGETLTAAEIAKVVLDHGTAMSPDMACPAALNPSALALDQKLNEILDQAFATPAAKL